MSFESIYKDDYIQINSDGNTTIMTFYGQSIPEDLYETYVKFHCTKVAVARRAAPDIVRFLARHPDIVDVSFNKLTCSVADIEALDHLESLSLALHKGEVLNLSRMTKLRRVILAYIEPGRNLPALPPSLIELAVSSFPETDLQSINGLRNLKTLNVVQGRLETLQGIQNLNQLKRLELGYLRKLRAIDAVSELKGLRELELHNLPQIKDVSGLAQNYELKYLTIEKVAIGDDLSWIVGLRKLEKLSLNIRQVKTLEPLVGLNLKKLFLDDTIVLDGNLLGIAKKNLDIFGFKPRRTYNFKDKINSSTGELTEYWPNGRVVEKKWDPAREAYITLGDTGLTPRK